MANPNQKIRRITIIPALESLPHDASRGTCSICRKRPGSFSQVIQDFTCWTCQIEHHRPVSRISKLKIAQSCRGFLSRPSSTN